MKVPPEWSEFIASLSAARVRFLIVGAHALAVHGRPRATGDLDLWVDPTEANARRIGAALRAYGFGALARRSREFALPDRMATLGRPPLAIDVMTSISGVRFDDAWRSRRKVRFGEHVVGVIGLAQFRANKRAAGRPKDLLDIELLAEGRRRAKRKPSSASSSRRRATPSRRRS